MTLAFDPQNLTLPAGHFICGRYVPAAEEIAVTAPSSGLSLGAIPRGNAEVVDSVVAAARARKIQGKFYRIRRRSSSENMSLRPSRMQ